MSGLRFEGDTSGNVAEVDAGKHLKVSMPQSELYAGMGVILGQQGDGTYTAGVPARRAPRVSANFRLAVGQDTPMFEYAFNATAQDTGQWRFQATTMAAAQSGGFLQLNSGSIGTTTTGVSLQTWRYFPLFTSGGMRVQFSGQFNLAIPANQVTELGLFTGAATTAPADGVFFRFSSAGVIGVLTFNGVETAVTFDSAIIAASLGPAQSFVAEMVVYNDTVSFYVDGDYMGSIPVPAGNALPYLTASLPVCLQHRNTGVVTGAAQYKCGAVGVSQVDASINLPFEQQQSLQGLMGSQGTSGNTQGSTALYTNNLAAGAGVAATNTTAAVGVGLGGQFSVQPTLAAGTDGIISSYQVPAGSIAIRPRALMIKGVRVQGAVTTTLTGGPVVYAYSLAYGHTAVSLLTADGTSFTTSPTTKSPRREPLGLESYVVTAPAGTLGQGVYMPLTCPIVVNPGEFVQLVAKNLGTVTSAGVIVLLVSYDHVWV